MVDRIWIGFVFVGHIRPVPIVICYVFNDLHATIGQLNLVATLNCSVHLLLLGVREIIPGCGVLHGVRENVVLFEIGRFLLKRNRIQLL